MTNPTINSPMGEILARKMICCRCNAKFLLAEAEFIMGYSTGKSDKLGCPNPDCRSSDMTTLESYKGEN